MQPLNNNNKKQQPSTVNFPVISMHLATRAVSAAESHPVPDEISPITAAYMPLKAIVVCDGCDQPISQLRWKCLECPNIDLCITCKEDAIKHPNHSFVAVPLPPQLPNNVGTTFIPKKGNHIICDMCSKDVTDIRWKCAQCPNYDLCHGCYTKGEGPHHRHHPFYGMYLVSDNHSTKSSSTFSFSCDGCDQKIQTVRYHCIECPDFDLCRTCIDDTPNKHDEKVKLSLSTSKHDWILNLDTIRYLYQKP